MTLIYEYGKRKEEKGFKRAIRESIENLLKSGMSSREVSRRHKRPLHEVVKIEKNLKL